MLGKQGTCIWQAESNVDVLQGEHGTGRNVAPYVEMEWGSTAYELMWQLKELFDPNYVLNPGVILNAVSICPSLAAMSDSLRCGSLHASCSRCACMQTGTGPA